MKKLFILLSVFAFLGVFVSSSFASTSVVFKPTINNVGKCPVCGKENCNGNCSTVKDTSKGTSAKCTKNKDGACEKTKKSSCCKDKEKSTEGKK